MEYSDGCCHPPHAYSSDFKTTDESPSQAKCVSSICAAIAIGAARSKLQRCVIAGGAD